MSEFHVYDIIIVGAGISGLAAAKELVDHGCTNIKILEARNRIGGRIHTIQLGSSETGGNGCTAELGANWIHTDNNEVYQIAKSLNLLHPLVTHDEFDGFFYSENGKMVDADLLVKVKDKLRCLVEEAIKLEKSDKNEAMPLSEFLEKRFSEYLTDYDVPVAREMKNIFSCLLEICKEDCGDDLHLISTVYSGLWIDFSGTNYCIPSGYTSLLQFFESKISSKLELNRKVEKINWSSRGLGKEEYISVKCGSGLFGCTHTYQGKHILLTLPLGVLKSSHETMFDPKLPESKITAISNMGFGRVNKILLYYNNPFWKTGSGGYKLVWDQHKSAPLKQWARSLCAFKEIKSNKHLLVAWISGEAGADIEDIPSDEISETCTEVLQYFLQDPEIPKPDDITVSHWCSDQFSQGSYCYIKPGFRNEDLKKLATPIVDKEGKPILLFAGEATNANAYGTVHGAVKTGKREANNLLNILKNEKIN